MLWMLRRILRLLRIALLGRITLRHLLLRIPWRHLLLWISGRIAITRRVGVTGRHLWIAGRIAVTGRITIAGWHLLLWITGRIAITRRITQADNREASAAEDNRADSRAASAVAEAAAAVAAVEVVAARLVLDAADTKPATGHATPSSTRWTYRKTQRSVRGQHPVHWEPVQPWALERLPAASPPFECPAARTNEGRPAKARHRQTACSKQLLDEEPSPS